jgi:hypothetical protein
MAILLPDPEGPIITGTGGGTIVPYPPIDDDGNQPELPGTHPTSSMDPYAPSGTFVAKRLRQMFSFTPAEAPRYTVYDIGKPAPQISASLFLIRNDTYNTTLRFNFTVPSFLKTDLPLVPMTGGNNPSGPIIILPPPGAPGLPRMELSASEERIIKVRFDVDGVENYIPDNEQHHIETAFRWDVVPLNLSGPVYVRKNLPPLIDPNLPRQIEGPGGPTTEIKPNLPREPEPPAEPVEPVYTHLYVAVTPEQVSLRTLGSQMVELNAWIGDENVAPNAKGALKLQFGSNSVKWESSRRIVLSVDSLSGTGTAKLTGLLTGLSDYTATVVKPPINIPQTVWEIVAPPQTAGRGIIGQIFTVPATIKATGKAVVSRTAIPNTISTILGN